MFLNLMLLVMMTLKVSNGQYWWSG
uniref:Uncharacterized protein n=1 Tax=Rhizophora mucronata TaxID=61149 RepID=A0A2P2PQC7_RHIMU